MSAEDCRICGHSLAEHTDFYDSNQFSVKSRFRPEVKDVQCWQCPSGICSNLILADGDRLVKKI